MNVLIVQEQVELACLWAGVLTRRGVKTTVVSSEDEAIVWLEMNTPRVVILSLELSAGSAFAVADFVGFRHPDAKIIPVTASSFFSDGSVFAHIPNTCTTLGPKTPPEDLAHIVEHYGGST